jgi:hypothetical protein
MTDEPDKAGRVRQAVTAALILFVLLLAGYKSSPATVGYLRVVDGYAVQFIQWTREGQQIKGTVEMLERTETEALSIMFEGLLDGERFSITTKDGEPMEKITGRLKGDILTLFVQNETEHETGPPEFRRATRAEYAEATRNLKMRAMLNKGAY